MFEAKIPAPILKDAVDAIAVMADEGIIRITEDGISCHTVDQANAAMVQMELSKEAFLEYEATVSSIAIDISTLQSRLEIADKDDTIELSLDEEKHALKLKIGGFSYSIQLLDPASVRKEPKIPKLDHDAHVTITGSWLKKPIKAIGAISQNILMGVIGQTFFMESDGEQDTGRIEWTKDQLVDLQCTSPKAVALFDMGYISDIEKILSKLPEVKLSLHTDFPLMVDAKTAGGKGTLRYMIAPRVETGP